MEVAWVIFWVVFLIFFMAAIGVGLFFLGRLKWNYTWVLLEEQPNGSSQIVRRGRARMMSFGDGGEEIFLLKGLNKWRVAYGKRIGKNQIAWEVGQDGYWYNVSFAGLDKKLKELGVYPVDRDMRYAYASARKGIQNRYDQKTFMDKYGTVIALGMVGILILAMIGFSWVTWNGQQKVTESINQGLQTSKDVAQLSKDTLNSIATLRSGSGAITVAPKT